jgi:hypothetical protein
MSTDRLFDALAGLAVAQMGWVSSVQAQGTPPTLSIGAADLGGVVASASGPEAGAWVIAETADLPAKFARIVATDDEGRYMSCLICRRRTTASGCAATA